MLIMRTIEEPANPIGELLSSQQSGGFDYFALAVNPLGLYGVQPRTVLGKKVTDDPHSTAALLDPAVVGTEPAPHPSLERCQLAFSQRSEAGPSCRSLGASGHTIGETASL